MHFTTVSLSATMKLTSLTRYQTSDESVFCPMVDVHVAIVRVKVRLLFSSTPTITLSLAFFDDIRS